MTQMARSGHADMSALCPLSGAQRTSAQRVIRSVTRARGKPAGHAPWRPQPPSAKGMRAAQAMCGSGEGMANGPNEQSCFAAADRGSGVDRVRRVLGVCLSTLPVLFIKTLDLKPVTVA